MRPLTLLLLIPLFAAAQRPPLQLTLKRAVELATSPEGNARLQIAGEAVNQAQSRSAQARAALLPNFDGYVSYQNQTRNLEALGLGFRSPVPGFVFPPKVGPFNIFDVRAIGSQNIFDFSSIRRFQASKAGVSAAKSDAVATEDQVAAQVSRAYIGALRAEADLEAVNANVVLAEAVLKQAVDLKAAGTGTGIEITRARVQLANERQRLLVVENQRRAARLQLLRAMNLALDTEIDLTDRLAYAPVDAITLEQARGEALKLRAEFKAQQEREANARLAGSAVRLERLPSLAAFGDYGTIGTGADNAFPTRTYGISLRVPVFDGGRRDARRAEAASQYRQERVRTRDLKEQIELDVRLALDSLASAEQQVRVATEGLELAKAELELARLRNDAGVANSLEVTDAQTRFSRAQDNRIAALYQHNLARIDLAQATGTMERLIQ
jgi:outer membrane protein TolC